MFKEILLPGRALAAFMLSLLCVLSFSATWARIGDRDFTTWRFTTVTHDKSVLGAWDYTLDKVQHDVLGGLVLSTWTKKK